MARRSRSGGHTGAMKPRSASFRAVPGGPFDVPAPPAPPADTFELEDRVTHDRHGLGRVVGAEGDAAIVVDFGSSVQRFALPNAKQTKL